MQMDRSICGKFGQQESKKRPRDNLVLSYLPFLRNVTCSVPLGFRYVLCPQCKVGAV